MFSHYGLWSTKTNRPSCFERSVTLPGGSKALLRAMFRSSMGIVWKTKCG